MNFNSIKKVTKAELRNTTSTLDTVQYEVMEGGIVIYYALDKVNKTLTDDNDFTIVSKSGLRFRKRLDGWAEKPTTPLPTVYKNTEQSYTANCGTGYTGSKTIVVEAGTIESSISQIDANNKALKLATDQANAGLICIPVIVTPPTNSERKGDFYQASWKGSVEKGSNKIIIEGEHELQPGDNLAFEFLEGRGKEAFDNWPNQKVSEIDTPEDGFYARDEKTGKTMRYSAEHGWEIYYKWRADDYYSYGWNVKIESISGNELTVSKTSPIQYIGTVYFDHLPVLQGLGERTNGWNFTNIEGDLYMSGPAHFVNKREMQIIGNNVNLRSIKGFNSAGLWFENGNGITTPYVENLNIYMNGEYKHFAPPQYALPTGSNTWYDGPYLNSRGFAFWTKGAIGRNLKVYNAPSYAFTFGEGADLDGVEVHMNKDLFAEYTGWPIHMIGGGENGTVAPHVKNFKFVSERFMRAFEIQQATNGVFENGVVINGAFSQNNGVNGTLRNIQFIVKEGACLDDEKIKSHPIVQVNQLLAGSNASGMTFENVHVEQEGYILPYGEVLRGWQFYEGTRGINIINCSNKRPDVQDKPGLWQNSYGQHLSVPVDGLKIKRFITEGKAYPGFDWATENNVANAPMVIYGSGVGHIEDVDTEKIVISPEAELTKTNVTTKYPLL